MDRLLLRHPTDHTEQRWLERQDIDEIEPLLQDILLEGRRVYDPPGIEEMRAQRQSDLGRLDPGVRRLINPHIYHVSLTSRLWDLKQALIEQAKRQSH